MEPQGQVEGGGDLPGQTDDAEAVRPVGGDFELHHVVVRADDGADVVPGLDALLVEDEDAVGNAVGELLLLRVEVRQGADVLRFRVQSQSVMLVDVGQPGGDGVIGSAAVAADGKLSAAQGFHLGDESGLDGAENLVAGDNTRRDGGLFRVYGLVVVQQGGGFNDGVGKVPLVQAQLLEGAEHALGFHAPEVAPGDVLAAGKPGIVLGHGDPIPLVNIPGAGDNLNRLRLSDVDLTDPHVVAVGVALHFLNTAHDDVFDFRAQVLRDLHLGAGDGHGLGKIPVVHRAHVHKFLQPFTG